MRFNARVGKKTTTFRSENNNRRGNDGDKRVFKVTSTFSWEAELTVQTLPADCTGCVARCVVSVRTLQGIMTTIAINFLGVNFEANRLAL